jgi:hypothetical protein
MTPKQIERLRELERLIADEVDERRANLLKEELQYLATLELEILSHPHGTMPGWECPACGINLREHTSEMIEECSRRVREGEVF